MHLTLESIDSPELITVTADVAINFSYVYCRAFEPYFKVSNYVYIIKYIYYVFICVINITGHCRYPGWLAYRYFPVY